MLEKRVYVVEFTSKVSEETFIKVGVSSYAVEERFANDLKNYSVKLLHETKFYEENGSFIVESNFHDLLNQFKYNPKLRLTSGNTECFINNDNCLNKICAILYTRIDNEIYGPILPILDDSSAPDICPYILYDKEYMQTKTKSWVKFNELKMIQIEKARQRIKLLKKRKVRRELRASKRGLVTKQQLIERARLKKIEIEASTIFNGWYFLDDTQKNVSVSKKYYQKDLSSHKRIIHKNKSPLISGKRYSK